MYDVYVAASGRHGLGVFAGRRFGAGETIEQCPVLLVPASQRRHLDRTDLTHYCFEWEDGALALALGRSSLLNHSYRPNAVYETDYDAGELLVEALRPIKAGEEITINYGGSPDSDAPVWFEPSNPEETPR